MAKSQVIEKRRPAKAQPAPTPAPEAEVDAGPTCQHRWRIESPRGPMSVGRCKICNEEREFRNSTEYVWDNDNGQGYSPWRGIPAAPKAHDDDEVAATPRSSSGVSLA